MAGSLLRIRNIKSPAQEWVRCYPGVSDICIRMLLSCAEK